jgi:hypothetical protein
MKKKLEYRLKRVISGHRMSCVPPPVYASRFLQFIGAEMVEE